MYIFIYIYIYNVKYNNQYLFEKSSLKNHYLKGYIDFIDWQEVPHCGISAMILFLIKKTPL